MKNNCELQDQLRLILADVLRVRHGLLLAVTVKLPSSTTIDEVIKLAMMTLLNQRRRLCFVQILRSCLRGTNESRMTSDVCTEFMSVQCVELVVTVLAKEQLLERFPGNCPLYCW